MSALSLGENAVAARVFEKGVELDPKSFSLKNNLAIAYLNLEKYVLAAKTFLEAEGLTRQIKQQQKLRLSAAQSYYRGERTRESLQTLEPLLNLENPDKEALRLAGAVYIKLNQLKKAKSIFERLVYMDPNDKSLWQALGSIRVRDKEVEKGAVALEIAMRLRPLESAQKISNMEKKKEADLTQAQEIYVGENLAKNLKNEKEKITKSFIEEKTKEEASLAKYIQTEKRTLASIYASVSSPIMQLENLKALSPNVAHLKEILGVQVNSGMRQEAIKTIEALREIEGDNPNMRFLEGNLYYQLGDMRGALIAHHAGSKGDSETHEKNRFFKAMILWEMGYRFAAKKDFYAIRKNADLVKQAKQVLQTLDAMDKLELEIQLGPDRPNPVELS